MKNKQSMSGQMAVIGFAVFAAFCLFGQEENQLLAAPKAPVTLTPSLVAWVSSQSENIVEEMEAIVKQQVETNQFSVVYYLRYLNLYDSLKVVASKVDKVDKFQWIAKKVRAFGRVYKSVYNIVEIYMNDLDAQMSKIEMNEKKSKQSEVTKEWASLYETINYIKTHAPRNSDLAKTAGLILLKSPTGGADKRRSTRYLLHRNAFN